MANKVGSASKNEDDILGQLDEKQPLPLTTMLDEYNAENVKAKALENANRALAVHDRDTKIYDMINSEMSINMLTPQIIQESYIFPKGFIIAIQCVLKTVSLHLNLLQYTKTIMCFQWIQTWN